MCGIAGIISTEQTKFNREHFNILGMLNDERGGDSCGIFIDKIFQYGIKDTKMFRIFTQCIKDYPETAKIAFLHCRKASPGYPVIIEQAQPVILAENDDIKFVLMHNGTISNAPELAKEYIPDVDIKGMSDSQIIARIIYYSGYDVLTKYKGAAVFAIIDYRENPEGKIYLWKGSSCYNEYKETSERPLFYMIHDNKFYFSSMQVSLYCIDHNTQIFNFPVNTLINIRDNKLYKVKEYDRSHLVKYTPVTTPVTNYTQGRYQFPAVDYIRYNQYTGLYMDGNDPAHGPYTVYSSGCITKTDGSYVHTVYMLYGRLIYTKEAYDLLLDTIVSYDEDVILQCMEIIDYFAYNPVKRAADFYEVDENFEYVKIVDRDWYSLFNDGLHYKIKPSGNLNIASAYPTTAMDCFKKEAKSMFFDYEVLKEDLHEYIVKKIMENAGL